MMSGSSSHSDSHSHSTTFPVHLCFFLLILCMFLGFSWYVNYESVLGGLFDQLKVALMVSPLLLLLAVHWISNSGGPVTSLLGDYIGLPAEKDAFHRAGGTPWGVGLLLVLLIFMISYQSYFQDRWFPLLSR